jgi:hypothetical protein
MNREEALTWMNSLSPRESLQAISMLAGQLTIAIRGLPHEYLEPGADARIVQAVWCMNQIQHTGTNRITHMVRDADEWTEVDFVNALFDKAGVGG